MDTVTIVATVQESLYLIVTFSAFLFYAMIKGRQALINLILGLYFALLISLEFPFYDTLTGGAGGDAKTESIIMIIVFALFTTAGTFFFSKMMSSGYDETAFEGFWKKVLFALMATILVMAYSFHALPVTDLITPGTPIQSLFASADNFFYWLLLPLLGLYFL